MGVFVADIDQWRQGGCVDTVGRRELLLANPNDGLTTLTSILVGGTDVRSRK